MYMGNSGNKNYIAYTEESQFGTTDNFILQKKYPNFVGKLTITPETNWYQPVPGYNLYISYAGTLAGNLFPSNKNAEQEVMVELNNMASFICNQDVFINGYGIDKFKIK